MRLEQRDKELAAIGASIGANCRPCIEHHAPAGRQAGLSEIGAAIDLGLTAAQVEAALKVAEYAQQRAAEMTADKATHALDERAKAVATPQGVRAQKQQTRGHAEATGAA